MTSEASNGGQSVRNVFNLEFTEERLKASPMAKFLIVSGAFYRELADELLKGATTELKAKKHEWDAVEVPGALEIPLAIAYGMNSGKYDGYIALGTVIRGKTAHYDVVAGESSRALMDLTMLSLAPIGNGILTVENQKQAEERASVKKKNKGAVAARAAIELLELQQEMQPEPEPEPEPEPSSLKRKIGFIFEPITKKRKKKTKKA